MVDFVLIRSNGIPTYIVGDIAYHIDKFERLALARAYAEGVHSSKEEHLTLNQGAEGPSPSEPTGR